MIYLIVLPIFLAVFLLTFVLARSMFSRSPASERLSKMQPGGAAVELSVLKQAVDEKEEEKAVAAQKPLPPALRGKGFQRLRRICVLLSTLLIAVGVYQRFVLHAPFLVLLSFMAGGAFFLFLPRVLYRSYRKKRIEEIERGLVDIMDLLVVGLEAGLTFQYTLQKIVARYRNPQRYPLIDELKLMLQEIQVGIAVPQALRRLAARCEVPDLQMLVGAVIQSEKFGTSLAKTMRVYSEELRDKRRQRMRERIAKIPVKMLPPLLLFLVALFIILGGPAVHILMSDMFGAVR